MSEIPVTYLCWGCGSEVTVYEEGSKYGVIPALERWNLCYDCVKAAKEKIRDSSCHNRYVVKQSKHE